MKRSFLRFLPAVAVIGLAVNASAQNKGVAVNANGAAPNPMAILDVTSTTKGMLIPRMSLAQRNAIAAPVPQGLTVYVDDAVNTNDGFWVYEYNQWVRLDIGADGWDINGNNVATPATDFFGTRDDQDLVFRTNNAQVMRISGTTVNGGRYTHIGTNITAPNEQVDIGSGTPSTGALRIYNPTPGTWAATNPMVKYAATNTQGTIHFRPIGALGATGDSLEATFNPPGYPTQQSRDVVMWNGHWGNITGAVPVLNTAAAHSGGWRRLENEYIEVFNKGFTQPGAAQCQSGSVQIPGNVAMTPANMTTSLAVPQRYWVSPYPHIATNAARVRHQHMYLANELNVDDNQLVLGNMGATGGLCPGKPITSIGIYIGTGATKAVIANAFVVTIKHAPTGLNNLSAGFDNSTDLAQSCYVTTAASNRPTVFNNWETYTPLSQPFIWDGSRNVIIEIAYATTPLAVAEPQVLFGPSPGGALLTASWNATGAMPACAVTGGAGACVAAAAPGGMPWNCGGTLGGTPGGGTSQYRPVIRFTGTVAVSTAGVVAPPAGPNAYIWYNGALLAEATTGPTPWSRLTGPYSFRGPGTLSAERGVYDFGARLNDHVFDRAFDGAVSPEDAAIWGGQRNLSIGEMAEHTRADRHLPTMKGRASWEAERGFTLGDLANQLWTTAETQALYVTELHDRLNLLEVLSNDRPLGGPEAQDAKTLIVGMPGHTDAEKAVLLHRIDQRTVTTDQR